MAGGKDCKYLALALLLAGGVASTSPVLAQEAEQAAAVEDGEAPEEEESGESPQDGEPDIESDTDLEKEEAERGRDITSGAMPAEDEDRLLKAPVGAPENADPKFLEALENFQKAFGRYANEIKDYQTTVDAIVESEYSRKVAQINALYDAKIKTNEAIEREYRLDAIASFERFLQEHPNEARYTPDAMFRLAELYFEKANDDFLLADERFQNELALYEAGKLADPPDEPMRDYTRTKETFRKLIEAWPDYRLLDGAYYLLAYTELQTGNDRIARDLFAELIVKRPDSDFVPEAWVRIGEYHFDYNELELAKRAYEEAMKYEDSKFYDKALYKLAWTYYRQDDFNSAIQHFQRLVEYSDEQEAKTGQSGSVLRAEAVQYMAISLAEEDWDLDGQKDENFGLVRVKRYIGGDKPYQREVLAQLGEYLFDNTRYQDAIDIYRFMLESYPLDRNNPEIHEKIILALLRDDKLDEAFTERGKLSTYYGEGSDWYRYQEKVGNAEAVRYADNLVKDNLIQSATWYHSEAQKLRREAEVRQDETLLASARSKYAEAATGYAGFLQKYPNDKDFYQWNFYYAECLYYSGQYTPAYEQYRVVREMDVPNNEFQEIAAFNTVKAMEFHIGDLVERGELPRKVMPKAGLDDAREAAEAQETVREDVEDRDQQRRAVTTEPVPPLVEKYVTAMDRYVVLGLKNEDDRYLDAKLAFQSAKIYFDFKHYDTARKRFNWIVDNYPEHEVAYLAGSLILETHREENDYAALAAAAERLTNVIKGEQAEAIREEVRTLQLGALFKEAEQLFAEEKYEEAASKYVQLLQENPDTKYAAKALNNAAVAYENVKRYDSAMRLYERVYKEHPDDPLAAYALYRVAVNQERFFDFEEAVQSYLLFYDKYENKPQSDMNEIGLEFDIEEKRGDALRSAAVLQENLQSYASAAKGYERFVDTYPESDQAPEAQWQAVLVWEKAGEKKRMVDAIEKFNGRYGSNPEYNDRVLQGMMKIAQYHEQRGSQRNADTWYRRIIDEFEARAIAPGSPGAYFAAQSQFMLTEREYEKWAKIQIKGSLNRQKKILQQKIQGQKDLTKQYEAVWKYQSLDWTLASSYRIGKLFQNFATSLYEVPIPFSEDSEEYEIYRTQLEDIAIPLEDEAIARYEATIAKAREEKIVNDWTKKTLEELNRYKPNDFPLHKEERRAIEYRKVTGRDFVDAQAYSEQNAPDDAAKASKEAP